MPILTRPAPSVESLKSDPAAPRHHLDWSVIGLAFALLSIGLAMVFSATKGGDASADTGYVTRQLLAATLGTVGMFVMAFIDYRRLREWAPVFYLGALGLLVGVLVLGQNVKGAQAWFGIGAFQLQPSEPAKVVLIVVLSAYLAHHREQLDLRRVIVGLVIAGMPMGLIMLQPDLGTTLVFVAVTAVLLIVAGVRGRYLAGLVAIGVFATVLAFRTDLVAEYQRDRLLVFIDTSTDRSLNESYNVEQSQSAISLGGLTGWGYGKGPQTQGGLVPEQETDFIFTVVGEELGFVGASVVLLLFLALSLRILRVAQLAKDDFGSLLCCGVLGMLVFQLFENIGMSLRIMPVTGIPLPFLSYGGSSLITTFASMGIVLSVHMHRFR